MAGLPAARDAIREGTPVAYWRAGITHTASPSRQPRTEGRRLFGSPRSEGPARRLCHRLCDRRGHRARDRAKATAIGLERSRKPTASMRPAYELEVVERSFPAGKTELTWRSQAMKYGHVEQIRVNLQGEKLILIERSLQRPRGYEAPATPMAMQIFKGAGPAVLVGVVVIGWGFGLYYLFKMRNWDALTRPLPLALCAVVVLQVGLSTIGSSGRLSKPARHRRGLGPARRHRVARAERRAVVDRPSEPGAHVGRGTAGARPSAGAGVSASLVDGVSGGAAMAAVVRARRLGGAAGPRLRAVDLARAQRRRCELRLDDRRNAERVRVHRPRRRICRRGRSIDSGSTRSCSTIVVAIAAGHDRRHRIRKRSCRRWCWSAGMASGGRDRGDVLYRRRGFLAAWIAGMASGWLTTAMALQFAGGSGSGAREQRARRAGGGDCSRPACGAPAASCCRNRRRYIRARSSVSIAVRNSSVVRYG